jgi:hypothetical protein
MCCPLFVVTPVIPTVVQGAAVESVGNVIVAPVPLSAVPSEEIVGHVARSVVGVPTRVDPVVPCSAVNVVFNTLAGVVVKLAIAYWRPGVTPCATARFAVTTA